MNEISLVKCNKIKMWLGGGHLGELGGTERIIKGEVWFNLCLWGILATSRDTNSAR